MRTQFTNGMQPAAAVLPEINACSVAESGLASVPHPIISWKEDLLEASHLMYMHSGIFH